MKGTGYDARDRAQSAAAGADPGQWMTHSHNPCHAETGMMANLAYLA
ncbi:multicopper oxidase domain-containing protein [Micromonospora sp. NPDC049081]